MLEPPWTGFGVKWNGQDIIDVPLRHRLNVDLQVSEQIPGVVSFFETARAFKNCNATITELERLYNGEYESGFLAFVVALDMVDTSIANHIQDASIKK